MDEFSLLNKVGNAAKWSSLTQITSKLISPITNMILARLLAPEVFGIVATVTMIISFAEMFTDAGFQKYLVQHEFKNEVEKSQSADVAFWTNLGISLFIWGNIIIFRNPLADAVGNNGLGHVIAIACAQVPMTSFSSIQMALYRRKFDFKALFKVQTISALIPLFVTVPLAIVGLG
ncbi:MAG: oligosaccharide flippase family protein, partial [Oscillospiraceae bacterium]